MLELKVYDRGNAVVLTLEHSLLSLSKWEAKTKLPFMSRRTKTPEEMIEYYRCMLTSPEQDPDLIYRLAPDQLESITAYINDPMSADTFPEDPEAKKGGGSTTSDTIYMQMVVLRISFEAQAWHINRLMMLIAKTADAQKPPKKETKASMLNRWQEINQKNRERFKSKG